MESNCPEIYLLIRKELTTNVYDLNPVFVVLAWVCLGPKSSTFVVFLVIIVSCSCECSLYSPCSPVSIVVSASSLVCDSCFPASFRSAVIHVQKNQRRNLISFFCIFTNAFVRVPTLRPERTKIYTLIRSPARTATITPWSTPKTNIQPMMFFNLLQKKNVASTTTHRLESVDFSLFEKGDVTSCFEWLWWKESVGKQFLEVMSDSFFFKKKTHAPKTKKT